MNDMFTNAKRSGIFRAVGYQPGFLVPSYDLFTGIQS